MLLLLQQDRAPSFLQIFPKSKRIFETIILKDPFAFCFFLYFSLETAPDVQFVMTMPGLSLPRPI